jgi:hypothetical protein
MNLIDKYISEVGRYLPEKNRSDIEAEIRSMVEDMLEERGGQAESANEKMIVETLEELGDPKLLAAKYAPPRRYLIGPGWYEVYIETLKRVLYVVLPIFIAVTFILTLAKEPLDFVDALGSAFGGAFEVGMQIFFWITVIFILLERSDEIPGEAIERHPQKWTAAQLPEYAGKRQISVGEAITDIVMELFALLWVALPIVQTWLQGDLDNVPFINPVLWNVWLPVFVVLMVLSLILDVFKLKIGKWTPTLTTANVILCLASIVYIVVLVTTQQVINPEFLGSLDPEQIARLRDVSTWSVWTVNITAAILVGILIWDMVNSVRMARKLNEQPGMVVVQKNVS